MINKEYAECIWVEGWDEATMGAPRNRDANGFEKKRGGTSYNRYCTIPPLGPWGYNSPWPPSAHTPKYNVLQPKPYCSEHNPPSHTVS